MAAVTKPETEVVQNRQFILLLYNELCSKYGDKSN